MFDPTFLTRKKCNHRKGAVLPLFAMLLPVLLILCGFAINLAYMQLITTEMKVSTDVTSHAAGRALSEAQREIVAGMTARERRQNIVDETYNMVSIASQWNTVGGDVMNVELNDSDVHFGYSLREPNGMYEFTPVDAADIVNGLERASSIGIRGQLNVPLAFQVYNMSNFNPVRRSVATQVDRDIALVLDRSGSMLWFKDMDEFDRILQELRDDVVRKRRLAYNEQYDYQYYEYYDERRISEEDHWRALGYYQVNGEWERANGSRYRDSLHRRVFSNDVFYEVYWLYGRENEQVQLEMTRYIFDWIVYSVEDRWDTLGHPVNWPDGFKSRAPRHSRWHYLVEGVDSFLDVLGGTTDGTVTGTDQKELVSLVTFSSSAVVEAALTDDDILNGGVAYYSNIREIVDEIVPLGGTGIGRGLLEGLPPIIDPDWASGNDFQGAAARPFAEKTIVVLTDGVNTSGSAPLGVVQNMVQDNAVTIHTVTFTEGADRRTMEDVARAGGGKAYHANDGELLVEIFEEVANNLPTILTDGYTDGN